ncbi:TOBE domain-containing protein [Gellertiella hungarica]
MGLPGAATVGIRPEHLLLEDATHPGGLAARVEFVEELGDVRLIHLLTEADEKIVAKQPAGSPWQAGQSVRVSWRTEHLHRFDLAGQRLDDAPEQRPEKAA